MDYFYLSEKFSVARSSLMLPHTQGEAQSIADAFHECSLGMHGLNKDDIKNDEARGWIIKLEDIMNVDGLEDPAEKGLYLVKAETFSTDEKIELSRVIDELASWFHDQTQ